MAKPKKIFVCSNCDAQFSKWAGQCEQCGKWGTIEEDVLSDVSTPSKQRKELQQSVSAAKTVSFSDVKKEDAKRITTNSTEVDRVLGGGIVPGSLTLLAGDPGIGKSTLVAQIAGNIGQPVVYVSGEESAQQIKLRLDRLDINQKQLSYLGNEAVEVICKTITDEKPGLVIIDSIQTMACAAVESEAGSVNQIKASTVHLLETAKSSGVPIIIIGHVTKGGDIGGPRMLEHMVDVVLYIEGDKNHHFRLLRGIKNRFGSTNEVGIFDMQENGLSEVVDPSQVFMDERVQSSGSCMSVIIEGNRPIVVEVQALVSKTTFGYPQRKASGVDVNRLNMLLAVLTRRAQLPLDQYDVHINVVGGIQYKQPSLDAAICVAIASALEDHVLDTATVAWGEVGLGGEIRSTSRTTERKKEAKRFGLTATISSKEYATIAEAIRSIIPQ